MSDTNVANLIAKNFIARPDVKAIQHANGDWSPHTTTGKRDGERIPWKRSHIEDHLSGDKTYGHYLLSADSECKLFAFDVDLEKKGVFYYGDEFEFSAETDDLRGEWLNRRFVGRNWLKLQFKLMAHKLMRAVVEELDLPTVAAYSGGKGVHVYAFTGLISAAEAREGAQIVLDSLGEFEAVRGENFFKHRDTDPEKGFPNLSIETFPKQGSLDGKDLGNLMRLPLGRNMKSKDPTFFIDMRSPMGQMIPRDPAEALLVGNPWQ